MMINALSLPGYTLDDGKGDAFEEWLPFNAKIAIVGGKTALSKTVKYLNQAIHAREVKVFWTGGECNQSNHDHLCAEDFIVACDWVIGVGGGRALDLAKWLADSLHKPILCVPTIASTCAASSGVSVIYDDRHQFERILELKKAADHVILLPHILIEADSKFLHAGIGDAISKPVEINFSGKDRAWTYANFMAKTIAEGAFKILIDQGESAYQANRDHVMNDAFIQVVLAIIMAIGHASIWADEDYNSALAHALYNAFMSLDSIKKYPHGVIVAYGVLVQCVVDEDYDLFDRLYAFYQRLALPTSLSDLGVSIDHGDLPSVIVKALEMPDCQSVSVQLSLDKVLKAMKQIELSKRAVDH